MTTTTHPTTGVEPYQRGDRIVVDAAATTIIGHTLTGPVTVTVAYLRQGAIGPAWVIHGTTHIDHIGRVPVLVTANLDGDRDHNGNAVYLLDTFEHDDRVRDPRTGHVGTVTATWVDPDAGPVVMFTRDGAAPRAPETVLLCDEAVRLD